MIIFESVFTTFEAGTEAAGAIAKLSSSVKPNHQKQALTS